MMRMTINKAPLFLLVLIIMLALAACGEKTDSAGSPAGPYDEQKILITGLQDTDYEITVGELKKLPRITEKAEASRANGEVVKIKATGTLLENVLNQKGKSIKDYSTIRFTARDGYSIAVPPDILRDRPIILAYEIDGKSPDAENQPVRVVIPGERAMYWVRMLARVDLESGDEQTSINKVVLLETAVKNLPQEDYPYFENVDKAVKTKDLVDAYAGADKVKKVYIKAADGLYKNETQANFLSAYIKITGQEAPKFLASHLPQGMHVRDVLYINYGGTSFMAFTQGQKALPRQTLDGQNGIALSDVIKTIGLKRAEKYRFASLEGQSLELAVNELGSALICENGQGELELRCPEATGKIVRRLLSIECLQQ